VQEGQDDALSLAEPLLLRGCDPLPRPHPSSSPSTPSPRSPTPPSAGPRLASLSRAGPSGWGSTSASLSRSLPGGAALSAFSVGLTRLVVACRPDTAQELLASAAFADRPVKDTPRELLFHRAMGFAPSGDYWCALRRISSAYLFSPRHGSRSSRTPRW